MYKEENNYYKQQLFNKENKIARQYLLSRGITQQTALDWELGFCPISDKSKLKGRITIPIYDQNGNMISISGRLIYNLKKKSKYDHYPFPARSILFGLYLNKEYIKQQNTIFITEGQMDVIKAYQSGVKNVVCSFGAHCSLYQIAIAVRYCDNVYIIYDNDYAGQQGAKKIITDIKQQNITDINIKSLNLFSQNEDLDNYFSKHTKEDFTKLVDIATDPVKYKVQQYLKKYNL